MVFTLKSIFCFLFGCFLFLFFNWRIIALQNFVKLQHESAIGLHISSPFWTSLPSPTPSNSSFVWYEYCRWCNGKESACQCRRHKKCRFNPWVGKNSWRRKWQPTPVFLPGKFQGQMSLAGYSPQVTINWTWMSVHACTPTFFWFPFPWNIFLHSLIFSLHMSLDLKWVSCRQHIYIYIWFFFIYPFSQPTSFGWRI